MSVLSQVVGLAGLRAAKTVAHRIVTRGGMIPDVLPEGRYVAGACSRDPSNTVDVTRLQAGLLMGKISTVVNSLGTVGYYAPSILGVTTNAEAAGSTSIQASAAVVTELVRRCGATGTFVLRGPGVAGGPIQTETVTYSAASSTNVTVTAIVNSYIAGSFIQPTDGSDDPLTFIPNGTPIQVTDSDNASIDVEFAELPIACTVDGSQLLPVWPTDASLIAWIISRLDRPGGGKMTFSQTY